MAEGLDLASESVGREEAARSDTSTAWWPSLPPRRTFQHKPMKKQRQWKLKKPSTFKKGRGRGKPLSRRNSALPMPA